MEKKVKNKLLDIPGYRGYQSLEDRRDDDKRLREAISARLDRIGEDLTRLGAKLASERKLQQISAVERLVGTTRHLSDRVRTASYGYGGLFAANSVGSAVLDQIRQFDDAFQNEVQTLETVSGRLTNTPEGPLAVDLTAYTDEVVRLNTLFDARTTVVETAQPSQDATALAMLAPPVVAKVSPIASLKIGDALSILGDNFIVDAVVTFQEAERALQLVRVGEDGEGTEIWLSGGTTAELPSAKVKESTGSVAPSGVGRRAETTIRTGGEQSDSISSQYWFATSNGEDVSIRYVVGNETRDFVGKLIVDEDIQVYGQA